MEYRKKSERGFTLIEMIVVIALIGILMGVAFPQTTKFLAAGRDTKRISDVSRVIPGYLELYFNQNGNYPITDNWEGLKAQLESAQVLGGKAFPTQSGQNPYCYKNTDERGFNYILGVKLEAANKVLDESVAGSCGALICGRTDNVYCVQP